MVSAWALQAPATSEREMAFSQLPGNRRKEDCSDTRRRLFVCVAHGLNDSGGGGAGGGGGGGR